MHSLSVAIQTSYAELLEQLLALEARRSIGHAPGTFVTKTLRERTYYYFQHSTPGGKTRQTYVGPKSKALGAVVKRFERERQNFQADRARIEELAAILRAGGATVTDAASARILAALSAAGVFTLGGVLVGTHAFLALGNLLGVRWEGAAIRTEDVGIGVPRVLEVAISPIDADIPKAIEQLEMGFLPVPGFSPREPSTSFKVRGRGLRVDLVTPAGADTVGPIPVGRFHAAAAPVRYLELALEDAQPAAIVNGGSVLVTVPQPAHFAILKLLVAQDRKSAFQAKAIKDVAQAAQVIEALEELRPGEMAMAWRAARARGKRWREALERGRSLLRRKAPRLASRLGPHRDRST